MENLETLEAEKIINLSDKAMELLWKYGPNVVLAVVVLILGLIIINVFLKGVKRILIKRDTDPSLIPFIITLSNIALKAMLVVSVVGMVGIEVTSFVALIGAAGLAVGLALQGTLQNFAGGVIILMIKPFKAGDFIETGGYTGSVSEIQIFNTYLKTPDNKVVIIPNGQLANSSMINYTNEPTRRVDWTFGIAYGDSAALAKEVLLGLIKNDQRIKTDPAPFVALSQLADSSVNFVVRVWVDTPDYWEVHFEMNENVYNTFAEKGLNIPFPQMDVHVHKDK
jgi:small conductance mechanosensitive channel